MVETVNWMACKRRIFPRIQIYHMCTGVRDMALNKATCDVINHFVQISYGTNQVNQA
jgi:hypothetical protein